MLTAILILYFLLSAVMFLVCIQVFRDMPRKKKSRVKDAITELITSAMIGIIWPVIMLFALSILAYQHMADYFKNTRY